MSKPLALYLQEPYMATGKSEVVSIRVEPHIKAGLQSAAEREMRNGWRKAPSRFLFEMGLLEAKE